MKEILVVWEGFTGIIDLEDLFKKNQYKITHTSDGFGALNKLESKDKNHFSLLILGTQIKSLNALEFVLLVRGRWTKEELPLLLISTNIVNDAGLDKEAEEYGVNQFVVYQSPMQVLKKVQELIQKSSS